jgi:hypothetical protein
MPRSSCLAFASLFVLGPTVVLAQPAVGDTRTRFEAVVAEFQAAGVKLERPRAVVLFESGLLPAAEQERWADLISEGVTNIERLLNVSFGSTRLEYYISGKVKETSFSVPAFGTAPRTFLASDRVRRSAAPYLHEAVHHLIFRYTPTRTATAPHVWILEGFPAYVEDAVVARFGGIAGHVFSTGGNKGIDADARAVVSTPRGRELLAFIGRGGVPPDLSDRANVARPFYVMGQSLAKHLIEAVGVDTFVKSLLPHLIHAEMFEAEVRRLCGKPLERVTADWLERIAHADQPNASQPNEGQPNTGKPRRDVP